MSKTLSSLTATAALVLLAATAHAFEISGTQPEQCDGNIIVDSQRDGIDLQTITQQTGIAFFSMGCNDPQGYAINLSAGDGDGALNGQGEAEGLAVVYTAQINATGNNTDADCDAGHPSPQTLTGSPVSFCKDSDVTSGTGDQEADLYRLDVTLKETAPAAGTYSDVITVGLVSID